MQHAINAKPNNAHVTPRLDMDIRCALFKRVLPQPIDNRDDMLIVRIELFIAFTQFDQLLKI